MTPLRPWNSCCTAAHPAALLLSFLSKKRNKTGRKQQSSNKWFSSNLASRYMLFVSGRLLPWQLPVNIPAQIFLPRRGECHLRTAERWNVLPLTSSCHLQQRPRPRGLIIDREFSELAASRQSLFSSQRRERLRNELLIAPPQACSSPVSR